MRILVVEDDPAMGSLLKTSLEEEGCRVVLFTDGISAIDAVKAEPFDVLILDVMLPHMDGFSVARSLRREHCHTPILFLTARDRHADIVNGLDLGGDDYVTKPFSFEVLLARVRALGRRVSARPPVVFRVGSLVINCDANEVTRNGKRIRMSPTEFKLLVMLAREAGRVVTRERIAEELWGDSDVQNNTLDAFVHLVRQKVGAEQQMIETVRGVGYSLRFASC
jgi:DNA-binding response OmpR family regulator